MGNNNKKYILIVLFTIVVVLAVSAFVYRQKQLGATANSVENSQNQSSLPSAQTYNQAQEKSKNIPSVASSTEIATSELDPALAFLISSDASKMMVSRNFYTDQTQGYGVTYEESKSLNDASQFFVDVFKKNNFTILLGSRNNSTATFVTQNKSYLIETTISNQEIVLKIQNISK